MGKVLQDLGYTNMDALDISQKMLDEAKKLNVYKKFFCAALSAEPIAEIPANQYDGLICVGTLTVGHVKPVAFDEILRVVKPGKESSRLERGGGGDAPRKILKVFNLGVAADLFDCGRCSRNEPAL